MHEAYIIAKDKDYNFGCKEARVERTEAAWIADKVVIEEVKGIIKVVNFILYYFSFSQAVLSLVSIFDLLC
jgi:hypothetical protein